MGRKSNTEQMLDRKNLTDIEIALYLLQLIDINSKYSGNQNCINAKNIYVRMAANALETMNNPFAKKLLIDKMEDQGNYPNPGTGPLSFLAI